MTWLVSGLLIRVGGWLPHVVGPWDAAAERERETLNPEP